MKKIQVSALALALRVPSIFAMASELEASAARVAASEAHYAAAEKSNRSAIIVKNWSYDPSSREASVSETAAPKKIANNRSRGEIEFEENLNLILSDEISKKGFDAGKNSDGLDPKMRYSELSKFDDYENFRFARVSAAEKYDKARKSIRKEMRKGNSTDVKSWEIVKSEAEIERNKFMKLKQYFAAGFQAGKIEKLRTAYGIDKIWDYSAEELQKIATDVEAEVKVMKDHISKSLSLYKIFY